MKYEDWKKETGLKTEESVRIYFLKNLHVGIGPVAMYVCPKCDEILDGAYLANHVCILPGKAQKT